MPRLTAENSVTHCIYNKKGELVKKYVRKAAHPSTAATTVANINPIYLLHPSGSLLSATTPKP